MDDGRLAGRAGKSLEKSGKRLANVPQKSGELNSWTATAGAYELGFYNRLEKTSHVMAAPTALGMPEASRTGSGVVFLHVHFGAQMLRNAMNSKGFQAFGSFSLYVRVGLAAPAGRPQPAIQADPRIN